jgi:preprotein translocase subunit SecG
MLYGLLLTLFVLLCLLLIVVILVQKSRSSMGLGGLGGGAQMLFGGSGGQDLFQKVTWVMVALFMFGSLVLAIMRSSNDKAMSYNIRPKVAQTHPAMPASAPAQQTASTELPVADVAPVALAQAPAAPASPAQ